MPNDLRWFSRETETEKDATVLALRDECLARQREIYALMVQQHGLSLPRDLSLLTTAQIQDLYNDLKRHESFNDVAALLKDHLMMQSLDNDLIQIPRGDGKIDSYYVINSDVGGVTEKVTLCHQRDVSRALSSLLVSDTAAIAANYLHERSRMSFSVNGMIKLPKRGKITEVQREAIALGISRRLGNTTTDSTMVNHNGVPGLFIPFAKIEELSHVASGEEKTAFGFTRKVYQDNATILSVGEGTYGDVTIKGIGEAFALFVLCKDPDAIGGYLQNKATIKTPDGQMMYFFDQVLMSSEGLLTDHSLNLEPRGVATASRHTCGRNRSIINDADFEVKYESVETAIRESEALIVDLTEANSEYLGQLELLSKSSDMYKKIKTLQQDLTKSIETTSRRCEAMKKLMDRYPNLEGPPALKRKVALLERLLNKPTLYTNDGRAYQHTHSHEISVSIRAEPEFPIAGYFSLHVDGLSDSDLAIMLRRLNTLTGQEIKIGNPFLIHRETLMALHEFSVFPEASDKIVSDYNYLEPLDLNALQSRYTDDGSNTPVCDELSRYQQVISAAQSPEEFVSEAFRVGERLNRLTKMKGRSSGFIAHAKRLYQYATQQKIQSLVADESLKDKVWQAFSKAKTLDRVGSLQASLLIATRENALTSSAFQDYLQAIIEIPYPETHQQAVLVSQQLEILSKDVQAQLETDVLLGEEYQGTPLGLYKALVDDHFSPPVVTEESQGVFVVDFDPVGPMQHAQAQLLQDLSVKAVSEDIAVGQSDQHRPRGIDVRS